MYGRHFELVTEGVWEMNDAFSLLNCRLSRMHLVSPQQFDHYGVNIHVDKSTDHTKSHSRTICRESADTL